MNWEQLLSLKRQGDTLKRLRLEQDETRIGFEVDYDRIIFSSSFRSLQDKTQVIPFSKTSFVHTRLTHSLEVSVVGRSLGRVVGKKLIEKYQPKLFICGHSHILKVMQDKKYGHLHMNPGAVGISGFHKFRTLLRFEIEKGELKNLEAIELGQRGKLANAVHGTD